MRILFVAFSESIHTARWISQVADQGWDLHLFPSIDHGLVHPELRSVTVHHSLYGRPGRHAKAVRAKGVYLGSSRVALLVRMKLERSWPGYRTWQLVRLIRRLKPDVVHSMEFQHAGYLTLEAKRHLPGHFPTWVATNWGSDIYLFGRLDSHRQRIRQILAQCDFYSCECNRDVSLARELGLRGQVLPVLPNTGGFDLDAVRALRAPGPTSQRRVIMLKGYQHWAGRALVGLRALERCSELLSQYTIVIHSPATDVALAAELFSARTGVCTLALPMETAHHEILFYHGKARVSIGLSISDAISTSFLEALVMGSFPIQSNTSCANEWVEDGRTALLVPPEDPEIVEGAIRRALTDDGLVDQAAQLNWEVARQRLDSRSIQTRVVEMYRGILDGGLRAGVARPHGT